MDFDEQYSVAGYCCSCRHGCRTVGCCSHVMAVIWYTLHIDHNDAAKYFPSSNLNHVFNNWWDEYSESESETEAELDPSASSDSDSDS